MHSKTHPHSSILGMHWDPANAVLAIMLVLPALIFVIMFITFAAQAAEAQAYQVLYNFTGGADGAAPQAGLTMDTAGHLYGTTYAGGSMKCPRNSGEFPGCGVVFRLSNLRSSWVLTPIHSFTGMAQGDGANPLLAVLVFGPDGSLYGTTFDGGIAPRACVFGCGTVFKLTPTSSTGPWKETLLYRFQGGVDGRHPASDVVFDRSGNLYGTTLGGGIYNEGTVYELSPSRGGWTESVPYSFVGGTDGYDPWGGVIFDAGGALYGTTDQGGDLGYGTVFQLVPSPSGWTENILYAFTGGQDGGLPAGDLLFDQSGNLYGISGFPGTVFMLTPGWSFTVLYELGQWGSGGQGLTMDAAGNLYGTTDRGGIGDCTDGCGEVFELTPISGGWTYKLLYDFTGGEDGARPLSTVLIDPQGNLYGTAQVGGAYGYGVVWEITP